MEFTSTNLPHNIAHGLYHEKGYDVAEQHVHKLFYVIFYGTASYLKDVMSQETPTTFMITGTKGKPIAAATVEYFEGEGKDNPGNYSFTWTFDPEDIPENATKVDLQDPNTHSYFRVIAGN